MIPAIWLSKNIRLLKSQCGGERRYHVTYTRLNISTMSPSGLRCLGLVLTCPLSSISSCNLTQPTSCTPYIYFTTSWELTTNMAAADSSFEHSLLTLWFISLKKVTPVYHYLLTQYYTRTVHTLLLVKIHNISQHQALTLFRIHLLGYDICYICVSTCL